MASCGGGAWRGALSLFKRIGYANRRAVVGARRAKLGRSGLCCRLDAFTGMAALSVAKRLPTRVLAAVLWTLPGVFGIIRAIVRRSGLFSTGKRSSGNGHRRKSPTMVTAAPRDLRMGLTAQNIGLTIGWLLVGWVLVKGLVFAGAGTLAARAAGASVCRSERAEFCRRVEVTARAARASKAIADWEGWRPFRVAAIVDEAQDVKSFYFTPVDGRPLSPFAPGQYLTFRLPLRGRVTPLVRCYSLSDRPRQDYYRCDDQADGGAVPIGRELPPGRGSNFFHDTVHVGDVLDVRAPAGTFLSIRWRPSRSCWSGPASASRRW